MERRPEWFDPTMPDRNECVTRALIDKAYSEHPDRVFAVCEDGSEITYSALYHRTRECAAALQKLGVQKDDRVLVWLPNCPQMLISWFAINYIGACYVPINTSYRGNLLEHVITNSHAKLIIAHAQLIDRLDIIELANLKTVVTINGNSETQNSRLEFLPQSALKAPESELQDIEDSMPWDIKCIIYTSGTTGPSKGVLSTYCHHYTVAMVAHGYMGPDDRVLVNMPLFHISGTGAAYAALIRQGSIALFDGFSTGEFWEQIRSTGSTLVCGLVGSMAQFLEKNDPQPDDADNPLNMALLFPISETTMTLAKRYNFNYYSGFGMTELPIAMTTDVNSDIQGSCGKPRSGLECRLVDIHDCEVTEGAIGELIVRSETPWSLIHEYNEMPQATADAWRNGWFHTGDLFRKDEDGNYYYVDRRKDSIRRRGENISSQEVEDVVFTFPDVREVAVVGVPSKQQEDEVLVIVCPKPNLTINPVELFEFLRNRLAHFMLPSYIRIMDSLPKTETNKVRKHILKEEGVTADTWDRGKAGIVIKREKLG